MATSDTQRLLLQVDAAVELARKNMRDLANAVDRDAANMDASLGRVEKAHGRMTTTLAKTGQARMGMQQLSFQIGDVATQMAMGTRASIIFAQQSGQVIQALQLMGGQGNAFLRFLAGPWGIALSAAAVVLSSFAGKLFENRDEIGKLVDKMREQARQAALNKQADEAWKTTVEGLTEAIRKRREEQEKALTTDAQAERDSLDAARKELTGKNDDLAKAKRDLANAERSRREAIASMDSPLVAGSPEALASAEAQIAKLDGKIAQLKKDLAQAQRDVTDAEANVRGAQGAIADREASYSVDKIKEINDRYDALEAGAKKAARGNDQLTASLKKKLEAYKEARKAELDAANEANKPDHFGRDIADGQRAEFYTAAEKYKGLNEVKDAAQLMQLFRDADVKVDLSAPWCAAFVNAVLQLKGVAGTGSLSARSFLNFGEATNDPKKGDVVVLKRGNNPNEGHVGFFDSFDKKGNVRVLGGNQSNGVGVSTFAKGDVLGFRRAPSPASALDLAAKAAEKSADQDDNFRAKMRELDEQLISAQIDLVTGIKQQAEFAKEEVDRAEKRYEESLDKDVREGRLKEADAAQLKLKAQAVATAKKANIAERARLDLLEKANQAQQQDTDITIERLRFADEMAKTQAEHRKIQLDILDALYAQREADLKIAKAKAEAAQDWEEAARIQKDLDTLPERKSNDVARTNRDTMNPLEKWADGIPKTAAQMQEFFQQLEVDGINGAIDSIMALADGFESFKDTAINAIKAVIAQLIRMQLMKMAMNLIGGAAGGAGGALAGGFSTAGLTFGMGGGGLAGIPGILPGGASGLSGTIGGRGGRDANILSINGRPQWRVERGETLAVIPKAPSIHFPKPANANAPVMDGSGGDTFHFHFPEGTSERQARRTALQAASTFKRAIAGAQRKGS